MAASGIEIERKYLLDRLPAIPAGAVRWRIEQGYLAPSKLNLESTATAPRVGDAEFGYGRLRRVTLDDGSIICTHTVKSGVGVQRAEREREITLAEFARHWPRTEHRRLRKTRWRIPHGGVIWEIDDLENGWIALAEVELETPDQPVAPPQWLAPHIVREVTDDPAYTNSALSERVTSVW